jgi:intracellular septation protein
LRADRGAGSGPAFEPAFGPHTRYESATRTARQRHPRHLRPAAADFLCDAAARRRPSRSLHADPAPFTVRLTLKLPDQIMKFLFDLFPIILFFVAFKIWGIFTATAVAIVATLVQIAWVAFRHRKVDPMLWVSLGVVVVFGGATLVLHNDTFIKWKPTVLYWAFSVALIVSQLGFNKNLIEAMMGKQITLPHAIWGKLNLIWAVFFVLLGLLNLFVAYHYTTDQWVNFKLFGATGCLLVFIVGQSLWLSKYMKEE